jgi:hypothetical protein
LVKSRSKDTGIVGTDPGLEIEKVADDEKPIETQNASTFLWARQIFDDDRFLWHRKILVPGISVPGAP